jgi:glyoxylase-like metal-dependent hydrolase (beta-lactamase superfamily II)
MLVGKIRATTDKPVVAVFNTHVHGDHWLGNQAIVEAWPQAVIYAHPKMIEEAKAGAAAEWVDLMLRLTEGASAGTEAVLPTRTVDEGDRITVGGLHFRILHEGPAHTDTDIVILVEEKGLVYLGDNAGNGRILRMQNGSFRGNVAALERALTLGATVFVPGHGPSGGAEVVKGYRDFLKTLYETVQAGYEDGMADFEIRPQLLPKLATWQDWAGFEHELGGLLSAAYLEAEAADFE